MTNHRHRIARLENRTARLEAAPREAVIVQLPGSAWESHEAYQSALADAVKSLPPGVPVVVYPELVGGP